MEDLLAGSLSGLISQFSYAAEAHMPRNGVIHSGPGHLASQTDALTDTNPGHSELGNSSIVSFSR